MALQNALRLPIKLVAIHTAILILLTPVILATVNTEAPPAGIIPIYLIDFPAFFLVYSTGFQNDSAVVTFILVPLIAGSIQWFLIGLAISLLRRLFVKL